MLCAIVVNVMPKDSPLRSAAFRGCLLIGDDKGSARLLGLIVL
jgi:hypothetical protein